VDKQTRPAHSLERLIPDEVVAGDVTGAETLALHLARYEFASAHIRICT